MVTKYVIPTLGIAHSVLTHINISVIQLTWPAQYLLDIYLCIVLCHLSAHFIYISTIYDPLTEGAARVPKSAGRKWFRYRQSVRFYNIHTSSMSSIVLIDGGRTGSGECNYDDEIIHTRIEL